MKNGTAPTTGVRRRLSTTVSAHTRQNVLVYLETFGDGPGVIGADPDGATLALASARDAALIEAQFPGLFAERLA